MEKSIVGIKTFFNALNLVCDNAIQVAVTAQAKVLNIIDIIADSFISKGSIKAKSVIIKYATINPPRMAVNVLKSPILIPLFSGVDKFLYNSCIIYITSKMSMQMLLVLFVGHLHTLLCHLFYQKLIHLHILHQ